MSLQFSLRCSAATTPTPPYECLSPRLSERSSPRLRINWGQARNFCSSSSARPEVKTHKQNYRDYICDVSVLYFITWSNIWTCLCVSDKEVLKASDVSIFSSLSVNGRLFVCTRDQLDSLVCWRLLFKHTSAVNMLEQTLSVRLFMF